MVQTSYKLFSFHFQQTPEPNSKTYLLEEVEDTQEFASLEDAQQWIEESRNPALPYTAIPYLIRK